MCAYDGVQWRFKVAKSPSHNLYNLYFIVYSATTADLAVLAHLGAAPDAKAHPHTARWYAHISSFSAKKRASLPAGQVTLPEGSAKPAEKAAAPAKVEAKKPSADVDDLFGDDDDDDDEPALDEVRQKAKDAAMARAAKKEAAAKSQIVFDIKGWGEETNLEELALRIKAVKIENLTWGGNCN